MKRKKEKIIYIYNNIEFDVKFWLTTVKENITNIMNIEIYHKGEKINSIMNDDMTTNLYNYMKIRYNINDKKINKKYI